MSDEIIVLEDEIEEIEEIEITESGVGSMAVRHSTLEDREDPNQHPITAIEGLREELDNIESLKTVYSDARGQADYYKWGDGNPNKEDRYGLFVTVYENENTMNVIKVCDGFTKHDDGNTDSVFGVTMPGAAFVGGQAYTTNGDGTKSGRDKSYALVVYSGLASVRYESDVVVGDYVVPNINGWAKKSDGKYGYLVTAFRTNAVTGIQYAEISLTPPSTFAKEISDALFGSDTVVGLKTRMLNAESDIDSVEIAASDASARITTLEGALESLKLVQKNENGVIEAGSVSSNEEIGDIKTDVDETKGEVSDIKDTINTIIPSVEAARASAEAAATSATQSRDEAVASANQAIADINKLTAGLEPLTTWSCVDKETGETHEGPQYLVKYIKDELVTQADIVAGETINAEYKNMIERSASQMNSLVSKVAKYSVGEYSQAYGLTYEQAKSTLKTMMTYIPTMATITESYGKSDGTIYKQEFNKGYYYTWIGKYESVKQWDETDKDSLTTYYAEDTGYFWHYMNGEWYYVNTEKVAKNWEPYSWVSSLSTAVSFDSKYNYGTEGNYWVVANNDVVLEVVESWSEDGKDIHREYYDIDGKKHHLYSESEASWKEIEPTYHFDKITTFTYDVCGLYLFTGGKWVKVASVVDEDIGRVMSAIYQNANEVSMAVTSMRGDFAGLQAKVDGQESSIQSATSHIIGDCISLEVWNQDIAEVGKIYFVANEDAEDEGQKNLYYYHDGEEWVSTKYSYEAGLAGTLTTIKQKADKNGASISQVVEAVGKDGEVTTTSIVQSIIDDKSSITLLADTIQLEANDITLDAYVTFTNLANIETDEEGKKKTIINGGNIQTDSLSAISANLGMVESGCIQSPNYAEPNIIIWSDATTAAVEYDKWFEYEKNDDDSYTVIGVGDYGYSKNFIIPSIYKDLPVTSIAENAFEGLSITSVTIPSNITSIGKNAFFECSDLTEIRYNATECADLSSNHNAFYRAGKQQSGITLIIGANVKRIPAYLFSTYEVGLGFDESQPKITNVMFENECVCSTIGDSAFKSCNRLTSVYYNGTAEEFALINIGSNNTTFTDNVYYYSETKPENDGNYWHYNESNGFKISCDDKNMIDSKYFKVARDGKITATSGDIGNCTISSDGAITSANGNFQVDARGNLRATSANINGYVRSDDYGKITQMIQCGVSGAVIDFSSGDSSQYLNYELDSNDNTAIITGFSESATEEQQKQLIVPDTYIDPNTGIKYQITSIRTASSDANGAFEGNTNINVLVLPNVVNFSVGDKAFKNCTSLKQIYLPKSASLDEQCFKGCSSLTHIFYSENSYQEDKYDEYKNVGLFNKRRSNVINEEWIEMTMEANGIQSPYYQYVCEHRVAIDGYKNGFNFIAIDCLDSRGVSIGGFSVNSDTISYPIELTYDEKLIFSKTDSDYVHRAIHAKIDKDTNEIVFSFSYCPHVNDGGTNKKYAVNWDSTSWGFLLDLIEYSMPILYKTENVINDNNYWYYEMSGWQISSDTNGNMINSTYFKVSHDGRIIATDANFSGHLTAGTIGGLVIDNGIKGYVDDIESFSLTSTGLNMSDKSASLTVGNFKVYYDGTKTSLQTTGPLCIQGIKSGGVVTEIKLMDDNGVSVTNIPVSMKITGDATGTRVNVTLIAGSQLYNAYSSTIYYQIAKAKIVGTHDYTDSDTKTFTLAIESGNNESNTYTIELSGSETGFWGTYIRLSLDNKTWYFDDSLSGLNEEEVVTTVSNTEYKNNIILTGNLIPSDKKYTLGSSDIWWNGAFLGSSPIVQSDYNQKNTIQNLSDVYGDVFDSLIPVTYKYNDGVSDRTHTGFIAQDVKNAIEGAGLTTKEMAAYCEWEIDDGSIRCALRYEEFIALCVDQIQKLKKQVGILTNELNELKTQQNDCSSSDKSD